MTSTSGQSIPWKRSRQRLPVALAPAFHPDSLRHAAWNGHKTSASKLRESARLRWRKQGSARRQKEIVNRAFDIRIRAQLFEALCFSTTLTVRRRSARKLSQTRLFCLLHALHSRAIIVEWSATSREEQKRMANPRPRSHGYFPVGMGARIADLSQRS
jgi:hypothetical protein